jgi:uncharacterized membrane protein
VQEKSIHRVFVVSVLAKGAHALIEIAGGLLLYLLSAEAIARWLDEVDPHNWVERHFPFSEQSFFAFYLLSHGLVKSILVFGLLREKLWAYPASFVVFGLFIAYQLYLMTSAASVALVALTVFDVFIAWLTYVEYQKLRGHEHVEVSAP